MPSRDTAALHALTQQRSGAVSALLVRVVEGGSYVADIARRRLPRRRIQSTRLRTARAKRRDIEPRPDPHGRRQKIVYLLAACRAFPARDFDDQLQRGAVNWRHRASPP